MLANYDEIRKGPSDSLLLVKSGEDTKNPSARISLIPEGDGSYRVNSAWMANDSEVNAVSLGAVYLPREALQRYAQENSGRLESLGIDMAQGTESEIMLTEAQYDALTGSDLNFEGRIQNDVRRGARSLTDKEAVAFLRNEAYRGLYADTPEAGAARNLIGIIEQKGLKAGLPPEQARAFGRTTALIALQLHRASGLPVEMFGNIDMRDIAYARWLADREGQTWSETHDQPLNPGVDLDHEFELVQIDPTFEGRDYRDLRRKKNIPIEILKNIRENTPVENMHTGWKIHVTGDSIDHSLNSEIGGDSQYRKTTEHYEVMQALPELIRHAYLSESHPDGKGRPEIKQVHRMFTPARIGDSIYTIKFTVLEYADGQFQVEGNVVSNKLYDHSIAKKAPAGTSQIPSNKSPSSGPAAEATKATLREILQGVKDTYGNDYFDGDGNPILPAPWQDTLQRQQKDENASGKSYEQKGWFESGKPPNANIELMKDYVSLINLFETSNASSPYHELMHHVLNIRDHLSDMDGVADWLKQDHAAMLKEYGVTQDQFRKDEKIRREVHEKFARGFEAYLATGKAPNATLQGMFGRIRKWLIEVYGDVRQALGVELSETMKGVYDRMLAMPEEGGAEYEASTRVSDLAAERVMVDTRLADHEGRARERAEIFFQTMDRDVDLNAKVPVIHVPKETRATITDADRKAMSERFGKGIVNDDTGLVMTLSPGKKGAGHVRNSAVTEHGERKQALMAAFFALPELTQKAHRVKTTGDRKTNEPTAAGTVGSIKSIHRFLVPMHYRDNLYILKLTAKEYVKGKAEIDLNDPDSIKIYDQTIGKTISGASSASREQVPHRPTVKLPDTEITIGEMAVNVKDTLDTEPYLSSREYEEQTGKAYTLEPEDTSEPPPGPETSGTGRPEQGGFFNDEKSEVYEQGANETLDGNAFEKRVPENNERIADAKAGESGMSPVSETPSLENRTGPPLEENAVTETPESRPDQGGFFDEEKTNGEGVKAFSEEPGGGGGPEPGTELAENDGPYKAKNLEEAAEFAVRKQVADDVYFRNFSVQCAKELNASILNVYKEFPGLGKLKYVGSLQRHRELLWRGVIDRKLKELQEKRPGENPALLRKELEAKHPMPAIADNIIAEAVMEGEFRGIAFNEIWGSPEKIQDNLQTLHNEMMNGYSPQGCDTIKSVIDHEVGHLLTSFLDANRDPVIMSLYDNLKARDTIMDALSRYANENIYEFIAEAWAEFKNNPKPRATAKKVGERLLFLLKERKND